MAIEDFYSNLKFVEKKLIPDGLGGYEEKYVEGIEFKGDISFQTSLETKLAEQQGVKSIYTVTTSKNIPLKYNDVIKRKNEYYRITSEANSSPGGISELDISQYTAELFTLD